MYLPPPENPSDNLCSDFTNEVPFRQLRIRHLTLPDGSQFALVTNTGNTSLFYRGDGRNYPWYYGPEPANQPLEEIQLLPGQSRLLILPRAQAKAEHAQGYNIIVTNAPDITPPPTFLLPVMPSVPAVSSPGLAGYESALVTFVQPLPVTQRAVRLLNAPNRDAEDLIPVVALVFYVFFSLASR